MIPEQFIHCPRCGSTNLSFPEPNHLECAACGFEYFINVAATGSAILYQPENGNFLLVKRGKEPSKGKWDIPGGFLESGETVEEGMKREIQEELRISIEDYAYLCSAANPYTYKDVMYWTSDIFFRAPVQSDAIEYFQEDELLDAQWFAVDEVPFDELAWDAVGVAVRVYQDWWKSQNLVR